MEIIESLSIRLDIEEVKAKLRAKDRDLVQYLLDIARPLISPKIIFQISTVQGKYEDNVVIDGVIFKSRVLQRILDKGERVFPFIITIGKGLEEEVDKISDLLEKYYLDVIGNMALIKTREYLERYLGSRFAIRCLSFMEPGSLGDWPIEEQRPLFSLFRGGEASIGVRLTENLLMIPRKSLSGIFFPTEKVFYSCQLCPRERCEGRKASYDRELAKEYGILK
jgi:hypothetical protein